MSLINQKINIYNSNDLFFNDICFYFNNSKKRDIALSDRIKYLYQNTNKCDKGCKQIDFNLKTQQAQCDCKYNDIETEEKNNELIKDNGVLEAMGGSLFEIINTSNIFIVKCYKYIFRYIDDSFGAIISLILLVLNIFLTIFFYVVELNKIKIYVFSLTENYIGYLFKSKNTPPKKKNQRKSQKEKYNDKDKISIKDYNSKSNVIIYSKKSQTLKPIKKEKINSKELLDVYNKTSNEKKYVNEKKIKKNEELTEFFQEYLSTSLDELEFDDAIVKDKRTFCEYFFEQFKEKQNIAYTFFASDPIMTRSMKLILFIFDLILIFVINALFISEDYISMLYHLDEKDSFLSFFTRSIDRFIKTTIIGELIEYVASFFFVEERKIKSFFKREKNNKNALKENVIVFIKELKRRFLSFIILVFIIILISFFYLLCFNYVYPYTQIEWVKTSVTVIIIRQILSCLIIFFEVVFRFISFRCNSEKLYKLSKIMN